MQLNKLFESGKIGSLEIPNRLVVSAMSSHLGNPDGTPNEEVNSYLENFDQIKSSDADDDDDDEYVEIPKF